MKAKTTKQRRCRICHCTDARGCPGGCGWAERDLCSICAGMRDELAGYVENVAAVSKRSILALYTDALVSVGMN